MNAPTNPPPKSRESSEDRKAAIAAAARALIVEKGFEGLRTRDIAERVGINIATLHYHVPTKEALIALVADDIRAELREQSDGKGREHLSPAAQLECEFDDYAELLGEKVALLTALSELLERSRRDPVMLGCVGPMMGKWKRMIEEILARGVASGDFRADLDPDPAARMLVGAMTGFSRSPNATPENFKRLRAELTRAVRNPNLTTLPTQGPRP
ncbi:MAG: TetR/AcrR family transcriptional regulator [Devosia sp.]|jgi:AcrR family transcriptional regulator|uniref:TetR/AcrR family transcriptional regulator n=1 Tax=Devosia sp. TaxID=1871048 RepID=UPI0037BFBDB2